MKMRQKILFIETRKIKRNGEKNDTEMYVKN